MVYYFFLIFFFKCNIKAIVLLWVFSKMPLKLQVGGIFVGLSWNSNTGYLDKGVCSVIQLAKLHLTKVIFTLFFTKKIIILHLWQNQWKFDISKWVLCNFRPSIVEACWDYMGWCPVFCPIRSWEGLGIDFFIPRLWVKKLQFSSSLIGNQTNNIIKDQILYKSNRNELTPSLPGFCGTGNKEQLWLNAAGSNL